ncbi:MAG TPA: hypothetical protein VL524_07260, partial [Gemmatimonadaceae bacterium]|nr:hypothetical protein [Gemmatimonadaceae bacterium]
VRILLFRRISGIHPMITLVGAFAGVRIFGMVGVLIGPLLLSYFFELARIDEVMASELTPAAVSPGGSATVQTAGGSGYGGGVHEA